MPLILDPASYDTWDLRNDAEFRTEIAKDIYWVPIASLGKSRLTNQDCLRLAAQPLDTCRSVINSLYEAVQLFQNCNFEESFEKPQAASGDGFVWQYHSPLQAFKCNKGSCCEMAGWLYAVASSLFDQAGYLLIERPFNGHVMNYFKIGDAYYFVDLTPHHVNYKSDALAETGLRSDYYRTRFFTSALFTCGSPEQFVLYYSKIISLARTEFQFFLYQGGVIPPIGYNFSSGRKVAAYPEASGIIPLNHTKFIQTVFVNYDPLQFSPLGVNPNEKEFQSDYPV